MLVLITVPLLILTKERFAAVALDGSVKTELTKAVPVPTVGLVKPPPITTVPDSPRYKSKNALPVADTNPQKNPTPGEPAGLLVANLPPPLSLNATAKKLNASSYIASASPKV